MFDKIIALRKWFKHFKHFTCSHNNVTLLDTGYRVVMDDGMNISHFAHLRCKDCSKILWKGGYERQDALGFVEDITGENEDERQEK